LLRCTSHCEGEGLNVRQLPLDSLERRTGERGNLRNTTFQYTAPRHVTNVEECFFYHHMDLPGLGEVGKGWDLRKTIDGYLGHFDFRGKRVLDVGTASGFLSFEMEKRGAEVVSFDMASRAQWQLVPFRARGFDVPRMHSAFEKRADPIRNGYWLAHRLLKSRARVYYGDIHNIPDDIGQFDVVILGMVLPHLREPFYALAQTARLSRDAIIITQQAPRDQGPIAYFIPNTRMNPDSPETYAAWWVFSEGCFREMLQVLGFAIESVTWQKHMCTGREPAGEEECMTMVARRVP
jgi:SAM-dependent methyltransferase